MKISFKVFIVDDTYKFMQDKWSIVIVNVAVSALLAVNYFNIVIKYNCSKLINKVIFK